MPSTFRCHRCCHGEAWGRKRRNRGRRRGEQLLPIRHACATVEARDCALGHRCYIEEEDEEERDKEGDLRAVREDVAAHRHAIALPCCDRNQVGVGVDISEWLRHNEEEEEALGSQKLSKST